MANINKHPFAVVKTQLHGYSEMKCYIVLLTYLVKNKTPLLFSNEHTIEIDATEFNVLVNSMRLDLTDTKTNAKFSFIEIYS